MGHRGVATDVSAEVRADEAERAFQQAQAELAHVSRVTTLGEIAASPHMNLASRLPLRVTMPMLPCGF